jgi:ABC-2 type transport system ATP-binding protein
LNFGQKIYDGSVEEAMNQDQKIELASDNMDALKTAINEFKNLKELVESGGVYTVRLEDGIGSGELNKFLIEKGIVLTHLAYKKSSLEQKFLKILEETDD